MFNLKTKSHDVPRLRRRSRERLEQLKNARKHALRNVVRARINDRLLPAELGYETSTLIERLRE